MKNGIEVDQALLFQKMEYLAKAVDKLSTQIEEMPQKFVSQEEWRPVKSIVYGVVGLLLSSIVVAITALVVKK